MIQFTEMEINNGAMWVPPCEPAILILSLGSQWKN